MSIEATNLMKTGILEAFRKVSRYSISELDRMAEELETPVEVKVGGLKVTIEVDLEEEGDGEYTKSLSINILEGTQYVYSMKLIDLTVAEYEHVLDYMDMDTVQEWTKRTCRHFHNWYDINRLSIFGFELEFA